jgi:hypothetical protein
MKNADKVAQGDLLDEVNFVQGHERIKRGEIRLAICRHPDSGNLEFQIWWPGKELDGAELYQILDVVEIEHPTHLSFIYELARGLAEFDEFIAPTSVTNIIHQISHAVWERARIPETENTESYEQLEPDTLRIAVCKNPDQEDKLTFIPWWPDAELDKHDELEVIDVINVKHSPYIEQSSSMVLALKAISAPHLTYKSVDHFIDAISTAVWNASKVSDIETKAEVE